MATSHQLQGIGLVKSSEEKEHHQHKPSPLQGKPNSSSNVTPTYLDLKHSVTKESLLYTPSWVALAPAQHAEPHPKTSPHQATAFVALLRHCTKTNDLCRGTRLHDEISNRGLLEKCSDALLTMYARCGELAKARQLLDLHSSRNVTSWTALIAAYVRHGQSQDALHCFEQMQCQGISPDAVTFTCILKACGTQGDIDKGKHIHDEIARQGLLENDVLLGTALVDMYAKCSDLETARRVLEELPSRDVVSWSSLIAAYAQHGQGEQALNCFKCMQAEGLSPDAVTYASILKACGIIGAADEGKKFHDEIARQGLLGKSIVLGTALVDMYAKCGALAEAQRVLEEFPSRDVVAWNTLITGYAQKSEGEQVLNCFKSMEREGILPDAVTYTCILKACGSMGAIEKGKQIHDEIVRKGLLENNIVLGTALVDMYAKCGALAKAERALEELPVRDVVSWSALIAGYAQQDEGEKALDCLKCMQGEGFSPDAMTYACILKACGTLGAADQGEEIHYEIVRQGLLENDVVLGNALVDMYAKCGALAKAQKVLDELPSRDVVSWNALVTGYAQYGKGEQAMNCFKHMQSEGVSPSAITYACILKACGSMRAADEGKQIHDEIVRQGLLRNNIMLGNALVDMYAKCGALEKAQRVLKELPARDVVSWNALIAGYAQQGQSEQALDAFNRMQDEGLRPDGVTYSCILKACGTLGATDKGKQMHDEIANQGLLQNDILLGSALVDMYAKLGALAKARRVLEELPFRNAACWNALIAGYGQQGQHEQVLNCFECMQREGIPPDAVTFTCLLNMCSHLGQVEDGHMHFLNMNTKYGVKPDLEIYTCMIDLFGRAGHLEKAVGVIEDMPSSDCSAVWHALLGACKKWGDVNVGRWGFEQALEIDKSDGAAYVLMANIYAAADMQEEAKSTEAMIIENKAWKKPGVVSDNIYAFSVEDSKQAQFKYTKQAQNILYFHK